MHAVCVRGCVCVLGRYETPGQAAASGAASAHMAAVRSAQLGFDPVPRRSADEMSFDDLNDVTTEAAWENGREVKA